MEGQTMKVQLAWEPPANTVGIVGYKIRYGNELKDYEYEFDAGLNLECTIKGLSPDVSWHLVAVAYNRLGQESVFSNEVVDAIQPDRPTQLRVVKLAEG
jgi:hypothetical protein